MQMHTLTSSCMHTFSHGVLCLRSTFSQATDIDYFMTNVSSPTFTPQWIVDTYSQRNWVEVVYREAKGWLGLKEYQVGDKSS